MLADISKPRLLLSAFLVGSALLQASFASLAWTFDSKSAGAVSVVLLLLAAFTAFGALVEYSRAVGLLSLSKEKEVLLFSALAYLQIVPISIATGLYNYPLQAAALALALGLAPVLVYLSEQPKKAKK